MLKHRSSRAEGNFMEKTNQESEELIFQAMEQAIAEDGIIVSEEGEVYDMPDIKETDEEETDTVMVFDGKTITEQKDEDTTAYIKQTNEVLVDNTMAKSIITEQHIVYAVFGLLFGLALCVVFKKIKDRI